MHRADKHDDVTAMIEWPRPLSEQALKLIRGVSLGALVIIGLLQVIPLQLIGGLANHFFTLFLILSWLGPARRFFRRRSADNNEGRNEERNEGPAPEGK